MRRRTRSGNEQAKRKNGHGFNERDTKKIEGREAPQRAKAVGWQAVAVMVARLDETKKKNNKQKQEERNERKSEEKKDGSTSKSHNKRQK